MGKQKYKKYLSFQIQLTNLKENPSVFILRKQVNSILIYPLELSLLNCSIKGALTLYTPIRIIE